MLAQGWAFPSLYNSLYPYEVLAYLRAVAKANRRPIIWRAMT